jgi:hypothetical protein
MDYKILARSGIGPDSSNVIGEERGTFAEEPLFVVLSPAKFTWEK